MGILDRDYYREGFAPGTRNSRPVRRAKSSRRRPAPQAKTRKFLAFPRLLWVVMLAAAIGTWVLPDDVLGQVLFTVASSSDGILARVADSGLAFFQTTYRVDGAMQYGFTAWGALTVAWVGALLLRIALWVTGKG